jgi:hypothetical protein
MEGNHEPKQKKRLQNRKTNKKILYGIIGFIIICVIAAAASSSNQSLESTNTANGSKAPTSGSTTNGSSTIPGKDSGSQSTAGSTDKSGSGSGSVAGSSGMSGSASGSCYPMSDEDTCYEPGEYCRESDEGTTGLAGDGKSIICEDNDGLRWEPN